MLNRKRGEFAACTTSDTTFTSRSGRAWIVALLGTASLALVAAGPAGADPTESTRTKEAIVAEDWHRYRRPATRSSEPLRDPPAHGTRRHIPDSRGGPDSIIECINGTWVAVD